MYSYFRTNSISHIATLFIMALALRLIIVFYGIPEFLPTLKYMVLGEQMAMSKLLYVDIVDNVGSFSALIFGFIHWLFGKSFNAYYWLGFVVTLFQMFYITLLCHRKGFFLERNYIPGLVILLLLHLSPDMLFLSPIAMANVFLLLAFGCLVNQIDKLDVSDDIFEAGLYIGVAYMFQPSVLPFILWLFWVLNIHTGVKTRQILLVGLGFLIPVIIVGAFYLYQNEWESFANYFLFSGFLRKNVELSYYNGLFYILLPFVISVFGFFVAIGAKAYNNFQTKIQQILLWWIVLGASTLFFMDYISPNQFIIFLLPILYFMMIFFGNFKQKWKAEIALNITFFISLFCFLQYIIPNLKTSFLPNFEEYKINTTAMQYQNKKIAVLDNNWGNYRYAKSTLGVINWSIGKSTFAESNNYEAMIFVNEQFKTGQPDVILDPNNVLMPFLQKFPWLEKQYKLIKKGVYQKSN